MKSFICKISVTFCHIDPFAISLSLDFLELDPIIKSSLGIAHLESSGFQFFRSPYQWPSPNTDVRWYNSSLRVMILCSKFVTCSVTSKNWEVKVSPSDSRKFLCSHCLTVHKVGLIVFTTCDYPHHSSRIHFQANRRFIGHHYLQTFWGKNQKQWLRWLWLATNDEQLSVHWKIKMQLKSPS